MELAYLFEMLAASTWQRLADAERLRVSQSETALTDHLLLEMARFDNPNLRVLKTPIHEEDIQGTDWEWWIGTRRTGWLRYAAQAKRLRVSSGRYDQLNHHVRGTRQLDILQDFASVNSAIPVYCLYNHSADATDAHWHCERQIDIPQLGCSIAPIDVIKRAIAIRGQRTFDAINSNEYVVPWRCLVRCPRFIGSFVNDPQISSAAREDIRRLFGVTPRVYRSLPANVDISKTTERVGAVGIDDGEPESYFDREFYSPSAGAYPRRIAVLDLSRSDDLGSVRMRPNGR